MKAGRQAGGNGTKNTLSPRKSNYKYWQCVAKQKRLFKEDLSQWAHANGWMALRLFWEWGRGSCGESLIAVFFNVWINIYHPVVALLYWMKDFLIIWAQLMELHQQMDLFMRWVSLLQSGISLHEKSEYFIIVIRDNNLDGDYANFSGKPFISSAG